MLNLNWFLVSNDTYISFVSWKNHAVPTRRFWVIGQYVKSVRDFFITRIQSFAKLVGTLAPWLTRSTAVIYSSVCVQVGTYTFMRTSLIIFLQRHTPPPSPPPNQCWCTPLSYSLNIGSGERGDCTVVQSVPTVLQKIVS